MRFALLKVGAALLLLAPCLAQPADWADSLVKWTMTCSPRGCLMQTDVLRGASEDPPDAADVREYVSIFVAVDRTTRKPAYFAFHVDPRARQDQGIFIAFTETTNGPNGWKIGLDEDGTSRLAFEKCDENSCVVRVRAGRVEAGQETHRMDLLDKFLNANHAMLLYVRDGKPYRTMVLLSSFKKEYRRVLSAELGATK